jgi:hypothetical protein
MSALPSICRWFGALIVAAGALAPEALRAQARQARGGGARVGRPRMLIHAPADTGRCRCGVRTPKRAGAAPAAAGVGEGRNPKSPDRCALRAPASRRPMERPPSLCDALIETLERGFDAACAQPPAPRLAQRRDRGDRWRGQTCPLVQFRRVCVSRALAFRQHLSLPRRVSAPGLCSGPGFRAHLPREVSEGEAERREAPPLSAPSQQARACCAEAWRAQFRARSPHGAPLRRVSVSGPALPGTRHWRQSQSSEAPRRAAVVPPGRGPGASRVRGDEPRPRAADPAPSSGTSSGRRPLTSRALIGIIA